MTLHTILIVASFYCLTYALKESILFDKPRIWLIGKSPFFYHLFECYLCVGFHSGWIIYFIANPLSSWDIRDAFIWGLGSGGVSFIGNAVMERVMR